MAQKLRRVSILSTTEAGSGHPSTCMSCAEIMAALFFREMRWDPGDPIARNADTFLLSKGHAAPILWAVLHEAGAVSADPMTLRKFTSPLEGHPTPLVPWTRVATGSLGQGLSAAAGIALGRRLDSLASRVYCLLGDGECAEGSVWEAAQFASHAGLDNLCAIVDVNALGQSGFTMHGHDVEAYARKFAAFGWKTAVVDGHNVAQVVDALAAARENRGYPTAIIARTQKGKGVTFMESREGWHGKPVPKGPQLEQALKEVGDPQIKIEVKARRYEWPASQRTLDLQPLVPTYRLGEEVATREAYGTALVKLGQANPQVMALDGDTKNSTFSEKFKAAFPERFVEAYIAEQNMVGLAVGLASDGKIPFASTFAAFLTRAYDQIRMGVYSRPNALVLCGSHCGVSIGEDGASQMGLEDIAMFRALVSSTVLYPADAVATERLAAAAAAGRGLVYIRTTRPKVKVLYSNDETFPIGGSKVVRRSELDRLTVVGAGVTLHEALEAHARLAKEGIAIRVIDAYSVKPIDAVTLMEAARETGSMMVVEDHGIHGGLADAVRQAVDIPVRGLGVRSIPRSGTPKEQLSVHGIDAAAIVAEVHRILGL